MLNRRGFLGRAVVGGAGAALLPLGLKTERPKATKIDSNISGYDPSRPLILIGTRNKLYWMPVRYALLNPGEPMNEHECPNCGAMMESDAYSGGQCFECDHIEPAIDTDYECDCAECTAQRNGYK